MEVPDVIKNATEEYVTRNNHLLRFIRRYMHKSAGSVMAAEIYESFKDWFRNSYPGQRLHDFELFTKDVAEEGYKMDSSGVVYNVSVNYVKDDTTQTL